MLMSRMKIDSSHGAQDSLEAQQNTKLYRFFNRIMRPFIEGAQAGKKTLDVVCRSSRFDCAGGVFTVFKLVVLKMLPLTTNLSFRWWSICPKAHP